MSLVKQLDPAEPRTVSSEERNRPLHTEPERALENTLVSSRGTGPEAIEPPVTRDAPGPAPALDRVGPYRVTGLLGRGGMGIVYAAVHEATGERVAVKTVRVRDRRALAGLRAEVLALTRIRHSGVVRIIGEGLAERLPWYAMELLEGRTIATYNNELWAEEGNEGYGTHSTLSAVSREIAVPTARPGYVAWATRRHRGAPKDLLGAVRLFRALCSPLGHVHQQGIVHRDLKPANVFLRGPQDPVLVDFGLMSQARGALGREALESSAVVLGTVLYVSPEQIRGQFVDARADLYALGCMLYETLTGRPPFIASTVNLLLTQHLHEPPLPPSEFVELPPALDQLVLRLLAKKVTDRIGHAEDVARALAELDPDGGEVQSIPSSEVAPIYLYRAQIAGRTDVLERISDARDRAAAGHGSLIVVQGESGIGKTRLVAEVGRRAAIKHFQRFHVVTGECLPVGGGDQDNGELRASSWRPLRSMLQVIADRCFEETPAFVERIRQAGAELLVPFEPALRPLFASAEPKSVSMREAPAEARARLFACLRDVLAEIVADRPLLWILDDIQWADELTLGFISSIAGTFLESQKLLVLCTLRSEEVNGQVQQLLDAPGTKVVDLARLNRSAISSLIADMLAIDSPPPSLVDFIVTQCEGNPFFVGEYLRAAVTERIIVRRGGRWELPDPNSSFQGLALPRSVRGLITRRLDGLDEQALCFVEAAAVLGRELDLDLLCATLGTEDTTALSALETLLCRQILESDEIGILRFGHDKLREITYERTSPERRRFLHHAAAVCLEQRSSSGGEEHHVDYAVLAHHWSRAGVALKAGAAFVQAAEAAKAAFANEQSMAMYRAAVNELGIALEQASQRGVDTADTLRAQDLCAQAHEGHGDILTLTGRQEAAFAQFELAEANRLREDLLTEARLQRKMGKTWDLRNRTSEALTAYDGALVILGAEPESISADPELWWHEWLEIMNEKIWTCYWTGRVDQMASLIEQTRPVVDERGTSARRADFYELVALNMMRRDRYVVSAEIVRHAEVALQASLRTRDAAAIRRIRLTYGFALVFHGAFDQAEPELRKVLDSAKRAGDVAFQCRALAYVLIILRHRGAEPSTLMLANEMLRIAQDGKMHHYVGAAEASLGWVAWRRGDIEQARTSCRAALESWQRAMPSAYPFQWLALLPLLSLELAANDMDAVASCISRLLDISQQRLSASLEKLALDVKKAMEAGERPRAKMALVSLIQRAQSEGLL